MRAVIILGLLAGCANHPLDCALGTSFGPGYCQPGTPGYEAEQAGRGATFNPAALRAMQPAPIQFEPWPVPQHQQPVQVQPFTCMNMGGGMTHCF